MRDGSGRRIGVLGADGFIGSHVVALAEAAGAGVCAMCVKEPWRLGPDAERRELVRVPRGRWWSREWLEELDELLPGLDALVLLAYEPPPTREAAAALRHEHEVNAAGAEAVAQRVAAAGARVVFTSSADVYGPWHADSITEDEEPAPVSPYGRAKLAAEQAVMDACGDRAVCLRIATVFGPGECGPRAIPSFIRAFLRGEAPTVHGDGSDVRDYVGVRDVAGAIVNAATGAAPGGVLNVGSGVGRSTRDVLEAVAATMQVEPAARYAPSPRPPMRTVLDFDRARRVLGLAPQAELPSALEEEVRWLRRHLA